jgi:hypothetical protein
MLPGSGLAAITTLFEGSRAPRAVLEATRAAAEQVTVLLHGRVLEDPAVADHAGL